jgi:molybdopterin-binding protein
MQRIFCSPHKSDYANPEVYVTAAYEVEPDTGLHDFKAARARVPAAPCLFDRGCFRTVGFGSTMERNRKSKRLRPPTGDLLKPREAALELRISFPTIKQWIYRKKIRSIRTAGGHHRIPQAEVDRLLFRGRGKTEKERKEAIRRVSGRNQLVGRIDAVRISGLMAEVKISIGGQQITSIITASSAREMQLKPGQTAAALIKATEVMILRV